MSTVITKTEAPELTGPRYWRSLDELVETPDFKEWVEREFPAGASELDGVNRRHFLKIMAASFGVAGVGLAGCRRPEQYIAPYSKQPERIVPGVPVYYATAYPGAKDSQPLIVETQQARPTKIEGNPRYNNYRGATDRFAQASVLDLYDVDRVQRSSKGTATITREQVRDFLGQVSEKYGPTQGQGLAFLAEPTSSPTRTRLVKELKKKFPRAIWAEYSPVVHDNIEIAARELFNENLRVRNELAPAKRILSLDSDLLNSEPGALRFAKDFANGRRIHNASEADPEKQNRLYQVESSFTITGGMADHRLRLASGDIAAFAALIASEVLKQTHGDATLAASLGAHGGKLSFPNRDKWVTECVKDLLAHKGASLVVAGSDQPPVVHQLVFLINDLIGARNHTVHYTRPQVHASSSIVELADAASNGRIETLFVLGGNPAYNAPADLNIEGLIKNISEVVRHGLHIDETSLVSDYHIAGTHYLESWGDCRGYDGAMFPIQPMIQPLFEGIQEEEIIARVIGLENTDPYELVTETFAGITRESDVQKDFNRFLSNGFQSLTMWRSYEAIIDLTRFKGLIAGANLSPSGSSSNALELRVVPSNQTLDGRFANNGWLQEMPEPMNKLTWDNAILVSPVLAKELGYDTKSGKFLLGGGVSKKAVNVSRGREYAPVAKLTVDGKSVEGPIHVQPGLADYTVVVAMGYGRRKVGRIGKHAGFDVFPLTSSTNPTFVTGAKLELTGKDYMMGNTQEHWSMEGRAIIRESNLDGYKDHPDFVEKMGMESHSPAIYADKKDTTTLQDKVTHQYKGMSLYETPEFGGEQQWGMSIDLNTCTGCNACIIACQSENNIPIVGKDQVMRGREMHWLRLDRYYSSGDLAAQREEIPSDPQVSLQPMLCQHCEMAPCEQVCPVNATVHDDEGLNTMAYNRCVGTRYCSNNCPYKVRRFNFFDWNKRTPEEFYKGPLGEINERNYSELGKMQKNPDVTVRMRGVMEKCTFCQQRIQEAKINQKVLAGASANTKVPDGIILTACQQVCPTESIVFGDVADANTQVSKLKESDRDYGVLAYLNTRPRVTYLARLRNPNMAMPDYADMPLSQKEYNAASGHGEHHEEGGAEHGESHNGTDFHNGAESHNGHEAPAEPAHH